MTYTRAQDSFRGKTIPDADSFRGRFVELIPNEKVVWAIEFHADDPGLSGEMHLIVTFADADGGVCVSSQCDNIPTAIRLEDHETGSRSSLANLAALLEKSR
ncbi:MAG: SRPBCC domain-containing protein [Bryobacteraceae bacterium]